MNEARRTCVYCGEDTVQSGVSEHVLQCDKRPEIGLLLKIAALEEAGDIMLETIHSTVKAIAEVEGMRTQAWEIYRVSQEQWEAMKNLDAQELAKVVREDFANVDET